MAKKKRNLMAEVTFAAVPKGFDRVKSAITSTTDIMRQAQKAYSGNANAFEILGRANMSYAVELDKNSKAVLKNQYLYDHYRGSIDNLSSGKLGLSSVTESQMGQYKQLGSEIQKLLEINEKENILTEEQFGQYKDLQNGVSKVSQDYDLYQKNLAKVNEKTQLVKSKTEGLFSSLKIGSDEANDGFALLKRGFSAFIEPFTGPLIEKAKKNLAELMTKRSSEELDSISEQLSKKFIEMGKKRTSIDTGSVETTVADKKSGGLDLSSIGDVKKLTKATDGLTSSKTRALKSTGQMGKSLVGGARGINIAASGAGNLTKALSGTAQGARGAAGAMQAFGAAGAGSGAAAAGAMQAFGAAGAGAGAAAAVAFAAFAAIAAVVIVILAGVMKGIKMNADMMENYRESAHRANGSIQELTTSTFQLSGELGISAKEATAAVQALGAAGLGVKTMGDSVTMANGKILKQQEALKELSRQNAYFTKTTGASSAATAEYQVQMNRLGMVGEEQSGILAMLTVASRDYSISGVDLDKITNTLTKSLKKQSVFFTATKPKEYAGAITGLAIAAREAKVDLNGVLEFVESLNDLTNPSTMMLLAYGGALDEVFKTDADQTKILQGGFKGAFDIIRDYEKAGPQIQQMMYKRAGIGSDIIRMYEKHVKGLTGVDRERAIESLLIAKKDQADQKALYDESMETISQAWNQLMGGIMPAIAEAVAPLAKDLVKWFKSMKPMMNDTIIPAIKRVFSIAGTVLGVFFKILTVLGPIGSLLALLNPPLAAVYFTVQYIGGFLADMFDATEKGIKKSSGLFKVMKTILWAFTNPISAIIKGFETISNFFNGDSNDGKLKAKLADGVDDAKRKMWAERAKKRLSLTEDLKFKAKAYAVDKISAEAIGPENKAKIKNKIDVESKAREVVYAKDKKREKKDAIPVYTVTFGKDTTGSREVKMINQLGDLVSSMKDLSEKRDPNTARTADAVEKIHDYQKNKPKERRNVRLQQGSGEAMKDWFI